ncbi:MAG TPA: hypothetical protein VNT33_03120 [Telluria sp.]|nr:hypothetical protein [Telluria sp.]
MNEIQTGALPEHAFLRKYAQEGAFTDCYFVDLPGEVSQQDYVAAFYRSRVFRAERVLLGLLARRPASDADAERLGRGDTSRFSIWDVEARAADQLLMREFTGATRSWLMSETMAGTAGPVTRLYFGSAVVPRRASPTGEPKFGFAFHALTGFHRSYSRALLGSARAVLLRARA